VAGGVSGDTEFDCRTFERVVFGLLDAGLAVGSACDNAFARHAVDGDRGSHGDEIPDLNDSTDSVRPIGSEPAEHVGHGVPRDIINIIGLAVAVAPPLADFDVFLLYTFTQSFESR